MSTVAAGAPVPRAGPKAEPRVRHRAVPGVTRPLSTSRSSTHLSLPLDSIAQRNGYHTGQDAFTWGNTLQIRRDC